MSNTAYHRQGKARWWARRGAGPNVSWVRIGNRRADELLNVVVDLPPGTTVYIGCGDRYAGCREVVVTEPVPEQPTLFPTHESEPHTEQGY